MVDIFEGFSQAVSLPPLPGQDPNISRTGLIAKNALSPNLITSATLARQRLAPDMSKVLNTRLLFGSQKAVSTWNITGLVGSSGAVPKTTLPDVVEESEIMPQIVEEGLSTTTKILLGAGAVITALAIFG